MKPEHQKMNPIATTSTPTTGSSTASETGDFSAKLDALTTSLNTLKKTADNLDKKFNTLESTTRTKENFLIFVVGAIAVVFVVAFVEVSLDYFKYNQERHEQTMEKIYEAKEGFYTKDETDAQIRELMLIITSKIDQSTNTSNENSQKMR